MKALNYFVAGKKGHAFHFGLQINGEGAPNACYIVNLQVKIFHIQKDHIKGRIL